MPSWDAVNGARTNEITCKNSVVNEQLDLRREGGKTSQVLILTYVHLSYIGGVIHC